MRQKYHLLMLMLLALVCGMASCSGDKQQENLDRAESLMETHPDSAMAVLEEIDRSLLGSKAEKARYSLLMSMALDKNYIDTTSFDVLQPAIDYYLDNGSPDEKLRTYYYQGRIFENQGDRDNAFIYFIKAIDNTDGISDSLCMARTLVALGNMYKDLYDIRNYIDSYSRAADIYMHKKRKSYEFDCLLNALNGSIILKEKNKADSLIRICNRFNALDDNHKEILEGFRLSYALKFESNDSLKEFIESHGEITDYDANGIINLAFAHNRLGTNHTARQILLSLNEKSVRYDTLRYQYIYSSVLDSLGEYKEALKAYRDFCIRSEKMSAHRFRQKLESIEEKHRIELQAQKEAQQKKYIFWGGVGFLCVVILIYIMHVKRLKTEHANDLLKIHGLQKNLFETDQRQEEISDKIESLFSTRFKLLDGLASSYFQYKGTEQEQKRIYAEVMASLDDFSSEATIQDLVNTVNEYKGSLMDNFGSDFPRLSAAQYRLALYIFCGFSTQSISIFLGTDLHNLYVYKSRLKSVIAKSDSPRKEKYLKYFS